MIGVNDQYRGRKVEDFIKAFESLLSTAIKFAGGKNERVFVLSIPDWGVTPFANGRDREKIVQEIDAFNRGCRVEANKKDILFLDITTEQRVDGMKGDFIVADGLHPSPKEYLRWAEKLARAVKQAIVR